MREGAQCSRACRSLACGGSDASAHFREPQTGFLAGFWFGLSWRSASGPPPSVRESKPYPLYFSCSQNQQQGRRLQGFDILSSYVRQLPVPSLAQIYFIFVSGGKALFL